MFNLGMMEILVLGTLALIVIGPQQMPEVARSIARILNEFKRATGELTNSLYSVKRDTEESIQDAVNQIKDRAEDPFKVIQQVVNETKEEIKQGNEKINIESQTSDTKNNQGEAQGNHEQDS